MSMEKNGEKIAFEDLIVHEDEHILAVNKPVGILAWQIKEPSAYRSWGKPMFPIYIFVTALIK